MDNLALRKEFITNNTMNIEKIMTIAFIFEQLCLYLQLVTFLMFSTVEDFDSRPDLAYAFNDYSIFYHL